MPRSDEILEHDLFNAHTEKDTLKFRALSAKVPDAQYEVKAACFLPTQAHVFGLKSNHPLIESLHAFLK